MDACTTRSYRPEVPDVALLVDALYLKCVYQGGVYQSMAPIHQDCGLHVLCVAPCPTQVRLRWSQFSAPSFIIADPIGR